MSKSLVEKIKQESKTFLEIQDWIIELPLQCRPYDEGLHETRVKEKWVRLDVVLKILEDYDIEPYIRIRKVKVLQGKAKEEADKKGLNPDDLVIVKNGVNIEKIDGDPVSYLLKRAKTSDKFVVVEKQNLQAFLALLYSQAPLFCTHGKQELDCMKSTSPCKRRHQKECSLYLQIEKFAELGLDTKKENQINHDET